MRLEAGGARRTRGCAGGRSQARGGPGVCGVRAGPGGEPSAAACVSGVGVRVAGVENPDCALSAPGGPRTAVSPAPPGAGAAWGTKARATEPAGTSGGQSDRGRVELQGPHGSATPSMTGSSWGSQKQVPLLPGPLAPPPHRLPPTSPHLPCLLGRAGGLGGWGAGGGVSEAQRHRAGRAASRSRPCRVQRCSA